MKKVYIISFLFILIFSFFGCKKKEEIITSVEDNIEAINHVNPPKVCVLGDSIAYGYNIIDKKQVSGAIFTDKIEGEYVNYAVVGDTSTEMLELLHKKTNDIENKDIYIISIGANNILSYLEDVFVDEIVSLYAAFFRNNEDEIKQEFLKMIRLLDNEKMEYYVKLEIDQFRLDLPNIIDYIYDNSHNSEIYIQTVYNPFVGFRFGENQEMVFDLEGLTLKYISLLNEVIVDTVNEKQTENIKVYVVDVYNEFKNSEEDLVNANFSLKLSEFKFDPHPNIAGQKKIADLIYEKWEEVRE